MSTQTTVTPKQQQVSDSTSQVIGLLSHLDYTIFKYNIYKNTSVRFELKRWMKEYQEEYLPYLKNIYTQVEKYPIFADKLDESNIELLYFVMLKLMPSVSTINEVFNAYASGNKTTKTVLQKLYKSALKDKDTSFEVDIDELNKMMYITLKTLKKSASISLESKALFKQAKFTKFLAKGIELFQKRLKPEDINYYDKCTNTIGDLELNTYMYLSEMVVAYNYNERSLMGTIKK